MFSRSKKKEDKESKEGSKEGKEEGLKVEDAVVSLVPTEAGDQKADAGAAAAADQHAAEDGKEEQADEKEKPKGKGGLLKKFKPTNVAPKALMGGVDQQERPPMERDRYWEASVSIKSFQNLTKETIKFFFVVSMEHENPKVRGKVRLLPKFTGTFTLGKGEAKTPITPVVLFDKKEFKMSYKELERHRVKVDIWEISCWTFNTYLGYKTMKLSDVARRDPNLTMLLKRKLTRKQQKEQRQRGRTVADVAQVWLTISLEEIFDFTLECDNWTLELNPRFGQFPQLKNNYSRLTFLMPKNKRSLPGQNQLASSTSSSTTAWIKKNEVGAFFWPRCGKYIFRGTRSHLTQSYFMVLIGTTSTIVNEKMEKLRPGAVGGTGGRSLMNLVSVLQISVFQGQVKNFRHFTSGDPESYVLGKLCGNIKAVARSKSLGFEEQDLKIERPQQLALVANVSNLNSNERHLVVKVKKCESLPAADAETGLSDPFLRVTWDGSSMTSPVMKQTVRPVFNQCFFFPVRIMRMTGRERRKEKEILKCELRSRNIVKIEVWDDDKQTNADYLGGCLVRISDMLQVRRKEKVNMLGRFKKAADAGEEEEEEDSEEEMQVKGGEWFLDLKDSRVFDGTKMPLTGGSVHSGVQPSIHFEVFFFPDFPSDMKWEEEEEGKEDDLWPKVKEQWDKENEVFAGEYKTKFPDSIGARPPKEGMGNYTSASLRRFPLEARNPLTMQDVPLMAFVCPIIIPEKFSFPAFLMHWVHCLMFDGSTSQQRFGLLPNGAWKHTEFFMQRRKGAPQDHAVLLCSLLLGCKKDAFVCKGTWSDGERSCEHAWVMTREEGWVTFWDPAKKQMYHMPQRYNTKAARKSHKESKKKKRNGEEGDDGEQLAIAEVEDDEDDEDGEKKTTLQWEDEVEDARIRVEDMAGLPTIGRMPKPKMRADKKKENKGEKEREEMLHRRMAEAVAPDFKLVEPSKLVDWLPYDSIEVVFNADNLWANRQNHHPACITYDLEVSSDDEAPAKESGKEKKEEKVKYKKWRPLIQADEDEKRLKDLVTASVISPNVSMQPELSGIIVENIRKDLLIEMQQNIELHRSKKGVDTIFDSGVTPTQLTEQLDQFLFIHEKFSQIDPDFPAVAELLNAYPPVNNPVQAMTMEEQMTPEEFIVRILKPSRWNNKGSPFFSAATESSNYNLDQQQRWTELFELIAEFQLQLPNFPTKRGKKFSGFPVHFNTSEADSIREYLMSDSTYRQMIDNEDEDTTYTVYCKIYPLLGGVLSVWFYIGVQETVREV